MSFHDDVPANAGRIKALSDSSAPSTSVWYRARARNPDGLCKHDFLGMRDRSEAAVPVRTIPHDAAVKEIGED